MKTVIPVFFHILCPRYPYLLWMAEPEAVKYKSVIPVDDQPDQVRIPEPFPERICPIELFQDKGEDEHKKRAGRLPSEGFQCQRHNKDCK